MTLPKQSVEALADPNIKYMSPEATCKFLSISRNKLYGLIREGKLVSIKLGAKSTRISVESLKELLKSSPPSNKGSPIKPKRELPPEIGLPEVALADYVVRHMPSTGEMNMAASFQDILNRKASDIKPPPAYPVGSYHCLVDGPPAAEESSQKGTPCRVYRFKILAPGADVNPQDIAAIDGGVVGKIITGQPHAAFYLVENAAWRYKEFLEDALAIPSSKGNGEDKTLLEMEAEAPGKQVIVKLKHEISQDGKRMIHRIDSYARV